MTMSNWLRAWTMTSRFLTGAGAPNSPRITIKAHTGRVGIGTTGPSALLEFNADDPVLELQDSGAGGTIWRIKNGASGNGLLTFTDNDDARVAITNLGSVGIGTTSPAASAILELSTTGKGFLPPRVTTTQRDAISSPAEVLVVYNTTDDAINYYTGNAWSAPGGAVPSPSTT